MHGYYHGGRVVERHHGELAPDALARLGQIARAGALRQERPRFEPSEAEKEYLYSCALVGIVRIVSDLVRRDFVVPPRPDG